MKSRLRIFSMLLLVSSCSLMAQEEKESTYRAYGSVGVSIANNNDDTFQNNSYPSVEVGLMKENVSFGLVVGRSNLNFNQDAISNYWYEAKFMPSASMNSVDIYGILGIGNYINTNRYFIEYGAGFSGKLTNHLNYYVQASNWDGIYYVTPGILFLL